MLTHYKQAIIEKAIVHKVGNPTRGEQLLLSPHPLTLNDELVKQLLTQYFLQPFNANEQYVFTHTTHIHLNEVYTYTQQFFKQEISFTAVAALLAQQLYHNSTHVKVKEGELYVVHFNNIIFNNNTCNALGIFKSETKIPYLKVFTHGKGLEVGAEEGIDINKLDKGCLIIQTNTAEQEFIVLVVDETNKNNDAKYWVKNFLQVELYNNHYQATQHMLSMCKLFIDNDLKEKFEVSKTDQIDMLARSMEYFKTNDNFSLENFEQEVIHHPEVISAFEQFKHNYQASREINIDNNFDIHMAAVKKHEKFYKSILKLDKNFHVYIHGRRDLIEKGYDEMVGKNYYKLYFDEEQ
jgi:hypothetical protein